MNSRIIRNRGLWLLMALGSLLSGSIACRANPPLLQETDVFVNGQDNVFEYRIPVLVTSIKGTLLAFCDARVERSGDPPNYIRLVMKRSVDGGKTWGPLKTLVEPAEHGGAVCDSCGVVDRQTGTIWVFSDYVPKGVGGANAEPGLSGATVAYKVIRSDDDGVTWSQPIDVTGMVKKAEWRAGSFGPGKGIQMQNGRLVVPRYHTSGRKPVDSVSSVCFSDDHGQTWQIGGDTQTGGTTNESQLVELADGSLLLNMRGVSGNHRRVARSQDGGLSWSEVREDPALLEPRCQASLERYPDSIAGTKDALLFSNPDDSLKRKNMTLRLSYDGGHTWPVSQTLHPGPSAYSCLTILPDGTVGCLYERGEKKFYEKIAFAHFNLEWLTRSQDSLQK